MCSSNVWAENLGKPCNNLDTLAFPLLNLKSFFFPRRNEHYGLQERVLFVWIFFFCLLFAFFNIKYFLIIPILPNLRCLWNHILALILILHLQGNFQVLRGNNLMIANINNRFLHHFFLIRWHSDPIAIDNENFQE